MQNEIQEEQYEKILAHGTSYVDGRGSIDNILSGIPITHIAYIFSYAGSVRGNHVHPKDGQYILVLSGRLVSYSRLVGVYDASTEVVEAGPGTLLYCPPNVAHKYYFPEHTTFLNLSTGTRGDYEVDTIPYEV